jgi:hypothetical protein
MAQESQNSDAFVYRTPQAWKPGAFSFFIDPSPKNDMIRSLVLGQIVQVRD